MNRDPIDSLRGLITDLNFQIRLLNERISELEERGTPRPSSRRRRDAEPAQIPDEITCRRLVITDDEGTERVVIEVDDDDNATIHFCDADGTQRMLSGAFADGEAYTHWADAEGDAIVSVRCTAEGAGTVEVPEEE